MIVCGTSCNSVARCRQHDEDTILTLSAFPNRYYKSQSGVDASNWLAATWTRIAAGRADITVPQITHAGYPQASVMLSIADSEKPDESVVLGAHEDERHGPGAGGG